jgi:leucyl aminopeptidase
MQEAKGGRVDLEYVNTDPLREATDAVVLLMATTSDGLVWPAAGRAADDALSGELTRVAAENRFTARTAKTLVVPTLGLLAARRLVLSGVGALDDIEADAITRAAGAGVRAARDAGAGDITVVLPDSSWGVEPSAAIEAIAVGARLGLYSFDAYRGGATGEDRRPRGVAAVRIVGSPAASEEITRALRRAEAIAGGVNLARDLSNEPASTLTPQTFAERAEVVARDSGLEIEVLGPEELQQIGAAAILTVGGGSVNPPRLIRLRYRPSQDVADARVVGLVGKAITFDTGGYSIKPYEAMLEMKGDMAGGAAVLGAMSALRAIDCPVPVEATICAAENMISGTAFRPGDVIRGMNGVTMEILSTDAEGRLVLADGLVDTARRGATELIDLATLTGAAVVALGNGTSALFASDDAMAGALLGAAEDVGERTWRMPLIDDLEKKIEGDVADIKNTGGRAGGAITAALFLRHFSEGLPWAHFDIAGSSRQDKPTPLGPKGATGVGVRTLLRYLTNASPSSD